MTTVTKLAEEHWEYVAKVLATHNENKDVIEKCGFHYIEAFIHGYKHAEELRRLESWGRELDIERLR